MKKTRVAINGFGRIGRTVFKTIFEEPSIEVIVINDLTDSKTLAHLLKYDSIHKKFNGVISSTATSIVVNGKEILITAEKDIEKLPWLKLEIDVVIESTGHYLDKYSLEKHLLAGAKKVILSAPPKGDDVKSIVMGVNDSYVSNEDQILSNASCTTNCAAPMIAVLDKYWGIEDAYISTIHSYTGDQRLHDSPHKDLRRARAAALSIIPTSTGAAKAITKIFPHLENKIGGCGIRVPVPDGSLTDISCILKKTTTVNEINEVFKKASENEYKGIMEYTDDAIVSVDVIGNTHSCIFDPEFTSVVGNMVKIMGWYDNEVGYSNRIKDLIITWMKKNYNDI